MIDMEVSMEGNGPSQVHQQVPSSPGLDANVIIEINESNKMTPQGLCRRLVSAHQEMEVIDEILTSAKKSDFQNDYLELNANLSKKKEYLLKWDHFYSMIRGSLTEPRRKPNHDDVIWGFFLSVKLADLGTFTVSAAIDDRTP
ncbi:hypothetical protein CDAR_66221 [Caerostris darwini]|uniref:Uncharacterized protein n=1 Tax=Caerostris darwini TaxID=1538125 RepID=A0AAV4VXW4_9ARAC|nr:hypothetical protein CDAR_66221 [Caerostris darwini]